MAQDFPIIQDLPPAPLRNQPEEDYANTASDFVGALNPWGQAVNVAGQWMEANLSYTNDLVNQAYQTVVDASAAQQVAEQMAGEASDSAWDAANAAALATQYSNISLANANFRGEWSDLAGYLEVPSAVYHSNLYWQLLRDVEDVELEEPGASPAWVELSETGSIEIFPSKLGKEGQPLTVKGDGTGVMFGQPLLPHTRKTTSFALQAGDRVELDTSDGPFDVTLPEEPIIGTVVHLFDAKGMWKENPPTVTSYENIMGLDESMKLDIERGSISLVFTSSGWVVY